MGIDSRRADEMELFEVACAFGLHRPEVIEAAEEPAPEWDPIKARVEALKRGEPEPKVPPVSPSRTGPRPTLDHGNGRR